MLLTPPHVEEFLSGERRALLGGLDPDRSGCVCEILTPEEWDALTLVRDRTKHWFVGGGGRIPCLCFGSSGGVEC